MQEDYDTLKQKVAELGIDSTEECAAETECSTADDEGTDMLYEGKLDSHDS